MKVISNTALKMEAVRGMEGKETNTEGIRKEYDKNESMYQLDYEKSKSSVTVYNSI